MTPEHGSKSEENCNLRAAKAGHSNLIDAVQLSTGTCSNNQLCWPPCVSEHSFI